MPSSELMIAIGSPLTNALGIAGSVGSHCGVPVAGGRVARSGCAVPVRRRVAGGGRGGLCGWLPPAGADQCAGRVELGLRGGALGGQLVQLGLLVAERLLRLRQRRHRGLLTGLRVGGGLVGLLLGQPRGRLLVDLLGAGPLQIGDHLLRADGQRLTGRRGVRMSAGSRRSGRNSTAR